MVGGRPNSLAWLHLFFLCSVGARVVYRVVLCFAVGLCVRVLVLCCISCWEGTVWFVLVVA